jgi:hypothetical protein
VNTWLQTEQPVENSQKTPDWLFSLQPPVQADSSLSDFSTLKMETIRSYEKSVHTISTRRHIPEDGILNSHRRENLKSYRMKFVLQI